MGTILIVDDADSTRTELANIVQQKGHKALLGKSGDEGLQHFLAHPDIGLLLSDVHMLGISGLEMVGKMRAARQSPFPQVFFITAETNPQIRKSAKELGVQGWILKPFDKESIALLVDEVFPAA
jgi:two-component system chemotaxis response regulator CheY